MRRNIRTVAFLVILLSFFTGVFLPQDQAIGEQIPTKLEPLVEAYRLIQEEYVHPDSLNKRKLVMGAIQGMLKELPDPYNSVYNRKKYQEFKNQLQGNYTGIGMEVSYENNRLKVIAPFPGSPASQAGIKAKDTILTINGRPTEEMNLDQAVQAIRGKPGTTVDLIVRHSNGERGSLSLTRRRIQIPPVELKTIPKDSVVILDINLFNKRTINELNEALHSVSTTNIEGYIIDLRNNPGGLLQAAVSVASKFIDSGLITTIRNPDREIQYQTKGNSLTNHPIAVLINGGTASASEIVASAIQDHQAGILVGRKTFGKGLVQTIHQIGYQLRVKISSSSYVTPSGDPVPPTGLTPDIHSTQRSKDLKNALHWINRQPQSVGSRSG